MALNGGPVFKFNEAISLVIHCANQDEIDYYWNALSAGGDPKAQQCGWLKDKHGVSWQVVPGALADMMSDPDTAKAERVMSALLAMKKLDLAALQRAYAG
jgi:predicted 3-demethylubiquinone-9 3-methyltransferase (glyoxalase superfamily)